ncbi:hypothetical protein TNCV_1545711 [Trichonephila clavipes]|nr:hypothetical protein TNCV_1545711 [Trichonephila clavipes]
MQSTAVLQRLAFTLSVQPGTSLRLHLTENTGYCGAENISCGHHKNRGVFFSMMSRNVSDKGILIVFIRRENGAHVHPSYVTKIDRFGGKGILVCSGIMLGSLTPQYVLLLFLMPPT